MSDLQDLVLDVAFPCCAICRLEDGDERRNRERLSMLQSGKAYRSMRGRRLIAGSRAEGLAMEECWGHPPADRDNMLLLGVLWGVNMPGCHQPHGEACLVYHPAGCPAGYCQLMVTNVRRIEEAIMIDRNNWWEKLTKIPRCIHSYCGQHWLDTYCTLRMMKGHGVWTISGPAGKSRCGSIEVIRTLICSGPHHDLRQKIRRKLHRHWPPEHLIQDILQLPMLLVLIGHKYSPDFKRQARLSCSHCELQLIKELPESVKQGYIACKYVLKRFFDNSPW